MGGRGGGMVVQGSSRPPPHHTPQSSLPHTPPPPWRTRRLVSCGIDMEALQAKYFKTFKLHMHPNMQVVIG